MLDYLANAGFTQSLEALKQEARIDSFEQDPKAKWSGLLEKKWTSVIRLQKKVRFALPSALLSCRWRRAEGRSLLSHRSWSSRHAMLSCKRSY